MRRILLATAMVGLSASLARAEDAMTSRFGNTTISTDANGIESKFYFQPDGTFTGRQGDLPFGGTWKLNGNVLCLIFVQPVPGTSNPSCATVAPHKVGDSWVEGSRTYSLVEGIQ